MRRIILSLMTGILFLSLSAVVTEAVDSDITKTVNLKMSPEAVWSLIGDYSSIQKWHLGVAQCELISGLNNGVGAIRVYTLLGGGTIRDELVQHDAVTRTYSTTVLNLPPVVLSLSHTISVLPGENGGSVVEWKSSLRTAPDAPDVDVMNLRSDLEQFFEAGLAALQTRDITQ